MSSSPVNDNNSNFDDETMLYMLLTFLVGTAFSFVNLLQESGRRKSPRFYANSESLHKPAESGARKILDIRNKTTYITHMGLDPRAFKILHREFKKEYPRHLLTGRPRALDTKMVLALVLMYLHHTGNQESLCVTFGVTAASFSRAKNLGIQTLYQVFSKNRNDRRWRIRWPSDRQKERFNEMIHANTHNDFEREVTKGVFGFVDGLNLRIQHPANSLEQNAYYNGWKSDCFASQIIVFTPDGCICFVRYNCPGSWHDAEISVPLYDILLSQKCPEPFKLLADSAFPCRRDFAHKILSVPRENAINVDRDDPDTQRKHAIITKHRQAVEWGMRSIQGAFGRLHLKISSNKEVREELLAVIFWLHNYRTRQVGINQIRTVYYNRWLHRDPEELLTYNDT